MTSMPSTVPTDTQSYRLPELLHDIRLLDLLELSGTTVQASQLLNLSQPTVSRRYRALANDFGLNRDARVRKRCRFGTSTAMRLLRLGSRAHRLDAGVARVGTDLLHHHLLDGCGWLLPTPVRFRPVGEWAELIHQGVLDAALISGLELHAVKESETSGLRLLELGALNLALAIPNSQQPAAISAVLAPHRGLAPGLHKALLNRGLKLKSIGNSCSTPARWIARLREAPLAIALDPWACRAGQWAQDLKPVALSAALPSPLWLLLPHAEGLPPVLTHTLEHLQHHPALFRHGRDD